MALPDPLSPPRPSALPPTGLANGGKDCACPKCGCSLTAEGNCVSCLLLLGWDDTVPISASSENDETDGALTAGYHGGALFGQHELLDEIGRGGMGVIFRARQLVTDRLVALKTIRPEHLGDAETRDRFRREAEAAESLEHPHILPIYEVGDEGGRPFFTMQLAEGGSLADAMSRLRAGPLRAAVTLLAKVVRAIAYAHAAGVLHRDLKPGNILLDADGEPLVGDFGLAKWLDRQSDLTQSLIVFGTPGYVAPEQARQARNATAAADIYSLGAILYEILAGRPPFVGSNAFEVLQLAAALAPEPPSRHNPQTPRALEIICLRCLEKETSLRYPTAAELAEELDRWLGGRSIRARPVAAPTRVWRWSRRNPVLTWVSGICLILLAFSLFKHWENSRLGTALEEQAALPRAVAVLPLENLDNLGEARAQTSLLDRALLARLSQEKTRRITAVSLPPEGDAGCPQDWQRVAHEARTGAVLSGSVRSWGAGQRVILRLASAADGREIDRRVIETRGQEISAVAEAAASLVQKAGATEQPAEEGEFAAVTCSQEARDYLRAGKEHLSRGTPDDLKRSIGLFDRAVEVASDCAVAHAFLASAYAAEGWIEPDHDWPWRARQEAEIALRLDPLLAEAHRAMSVVLVHEHRTDAAIEEAKTAFELDPTEGRHAALLAGQLQLLGKPHEALRWFAKAERRQAQPGASMGRIGDVLADLTEDEAAAEAYRKFNEFRPGSPDGQLCFARLAMFHDDFARARTCCLQAQRLAPNVLHVRSMLANVEFFGRDFVAAEKIYRDLVEAHREGGETMADGVGYLSALGWLRRRAGDESEGRALLLEARQLAATHLREMPDMPWHLYALAAAHAALGEKGPALDAFDRAVTAGWVDFRSTRLDPRFDSVAGEPRFQQILSRLSAHIAELRRQRPADFVAIGDRNNKL